MSTLKPENIAFLADLFGTPQKEYLTFDPDHLVENESDKIRIFNQLDDLKSAIAKAEDTSITLFNFSNRELLDIYCNEKVGAIIKINKQSSSAFNPFATYYYLTDQQGNIESILSPGAKRISLSLPKTGGIATRIQQTVKQQGIKIGLQKYLASGSFTYYYKNQHPIEQRLQQKDYDGYTLDVVKQEDELAVEVKSWKDSKLQESQLINLFHSRLLNLLAKF